MPGGAAPADPQCRRPRPDRTQGACLWLAGGGARAARLAARPALRADRDGAGAVLHRRVADPAGRHAHHIYQATPIIATALAVPLLGEQVGWRRWLAVVAGFIGVLLVVKPSGGGVSTAHLCALAGGVVYSGVVLLTRLLRDAGPVPMIAWHIGGTLLASALVAPFVWQPVSLLNMALIALMGVFSTCGHVLNNRALALSPTSVVMPFHYTQIVWGVAFGWLFFSDMPDLQMLSGAAIIVASGLFIMHRERVRARQAG
ncbi:DMT family transporter [Vineibacter terrae]|uniref:DMT family transporter n=1 Tax=Vineibacter terrae TaxID=2586908 RepID=A0A5C8PVM3_9HYPH|nr:DMT family transporter [Vineibacter terrae]